MLDQQLHFKFGRRTTKPNTQSYDISILVTAVKTNWDDGLLVHSLIPLQFFPRKKKTGYWGLFFIMVTFCKTLFVANVNDDNTFDFTQHPETKILFFFSFYLNIIRVNQCIQRILSDWLVLILTELTLSLPVCLGAT